MAAAAAAAAAAACARPCRAPATNRCCAHPTLRLPQSGRQPGGGKLEPRHSDPLDPADSLTPVQWEREPILNLVTAVLSNCVLGAWPGWLAGCTCTGAGDGRTRRGRPGRCCSSRRCSIHACLCCMATCVPTRCPHQRPPAGFPFCFKTCGLGLAVLLVLVTLVAAELSMRLLLMSSQLTGKRSYEELARHAYGAWGHAAVQLSLVAMNVGSVVSYLLILTDTVSSVAGARAAGAGGA